MRRRRSGIGRHGRAGAVILACAGAAANAGCNLAGPAAYLAFGMPPRQAEHDLEDRPTVVYVDDRANVIGRDGISVNAQAMRLAIADRVSEDLMVQKVLVQENTIRPRDAIGIVSSRDRHGDLLAIDEIGRSVGAEQIIYVEMLEFSLVPDGVTPRPSSSCNVRVIDVANERGLFPPDDVQEPARQLGVRMIEMDPAKLRSPAESREVYATLAGETGERIAKLFYKHDARELGGRLESR